MSQYFSEGTKTELIKTDDIIQSSLGILVVCKNFAGKVELSDMALTREDIALSSKSS
jgi:hypothetical protein